MFDRIKKCLGIAASVKVQQPWEGVDVSCLSPRTHEEAKKYRKAKRKEKADKAARRRNRRK